MPTDEQPPAPTGAELADLVRHIHNDVLQPLSAASLRLQLLSARTPAPELDTARESVVDAIAELNRMAARLRGDTPTAPAPVPATPPPATSPAVGADDLRVYVVDDYADNRHLFSAVLRAAGMRVTVIEDGRALDQLLQAEPPPDIFLLDLSLAGEDGDSIAQRLRSDASMATCAVIGLSADHRDAPTARAHGFDGHLTKPIDVATFAQSVRSLHANTRRNAPTAE